MLLAVDIGNTDMVFGMHDGSVWVHQFRHPTSRYSLLEQQLHQEMRHLSWETLDPVIISSVVPGVTPTVARVFTRLLGRAPLVMGPGLYPHLTVTVMNAEEIGSDLVANSLAAYERLRRSVIIVDFGTALTFTTVDHKGVIQGVAIAPGLKTAVTSLFMNAAQLPEVPLELPESAIGKGTAHALQAGILLGYVGLVRELIGHIRREMQDPDLPVVATGGLSEVLPTLQRDFHTVDRNLTLEGLRLAAYQAQSAQ